MSKRDPYPSPKFENGFTLSGFRPLPRKTYNQPTHLAQSEEPWCRLHDAATLASTLRSVTHCKSQPLRDSLDFQLKSVYDHHNDSFKTKHQMSYQKETVPEHQREQKDVQEKEQEEDIRVWVDPQRNSIHSIK
ncbi:cilia- and flagella-associated protein 276 [Nelusetta ayraudi]|uniref:cilia- and flagella-associated protein 276 n=1 Tax=Nelusetta ayraudi TaxID=303726 RepID=UPI003F6FA502